MIKRSIPDHPGRAFVGDIVEKLRALDIYNYSGSADLRRLGESASNDPDVRVRLAYRMGVARGMGLTESHLVRAWLEGAQGVLESHFGEKPKTPEAA